MKFTLGWLKDFLETDLGIDEISNQLTSLGLEVESVSDFSKDLDSFSVALVKETQPHPDADRLQICKLETEHGEVEVVCGAPNARKDLKGIFAPLGSYIPGSDLILKKTKIRGVESIGMLLSERELGISDDHDSVIEVSDNYKIGTPAAKAMRLDDPVIEIAITPNRQDCLAISGIARDLSAAGLGKFKSQNIKTVKGKFKSPVSVNLSSKSISPSPCPLFAGRYIRGIKNVPSPDWMQDRLRAVGLRPISALVDITNYMTFTFGRPLHVFDADKISGDIDVRLSKPGEKLQALDGNEYLFDESATVITDDNKVLALGGIIGGLNSGCTENTKNVFIESALFDPVRTAITGRKFQIDSDARYRFERGIDPEFTIPGIEEATRLVLELCGGEASDLVISGEIPLWKNKIKFDFNKIKLLGGIEIERVNVLRILKDLEFSVDENNNILNITAPSWRSDIDGEADIVEEIIRVHGLDAIPSISLPIENSSTKKILESSLNHLGSSRRLLASRGFLETITWSFTSSRLAELFGGGGEGLKLENPISSELDIMRPSSFPNLISAIKRNIDRGATELALFEVGPSYSSTTPEGQTYSAVAVRQGNLSPRHWSDVSKPVNAIDSKADALSILEACGVNLNSINIETVGPPWFHPGRSGKIKQGPHTTLAVFGELHPAILTELDINSAVVGCEVFLNEIKSRKKKGDSRGTLDAPSLLPLDRDFSFIVNSDVLAIQIVEAAEKADQLIVGVNIFDVFDGKGIPEGQKSVAISVKLQPREHTLTDEQIDKISERIISSVNKLTGGVLRG